MAQNFASNITARQWYSCHGNWPSPHRKFFHTPVTGKPAPPSTAGCTGAEIAAINNWMAGVDNGNQEGNQFDQPTQILDGSANFSPTAQTVVQTYISYFTTPAYQNWRCDNLMSRISQWNWRMADVHDANSTTLAQSSDPSGAGSGPPTSGIPPSPN